MPDKKSPFINCTEAQVAEVERDSYIIQIGSDLFYDESGTHCAFTKEKIEQFYSDIKNGLRYMIENGSEEDKREAMISIQNFRIIPLRIQ